MKRDSHPPLIVIVGPTASGKTGLAIKLAQLCGGEVISADSRAIFRGLDIGTAKPTLEEQQKVKHWGIDLANPDERYTVAEYKMYAQEKVNEIRARGRTPILAGGTGLYIDAVVFDYQFPDVAKEFQQEELFAKSIGELHAICVNNNIVIPKDEKNPRRLVGLILRGNQQPQRRNTPKPDTIIVGITTEKQKLFSRIQIRSRDIWNTGVIEEASHVASRYGWGTEAMTGNIYPLIRKLLAGEITQAEAIERFSTLDRQLAKRQMTWFRKNPYIMWATVDEAYQYCARLLGP